MDRQGKIEKKNKTLGTERCVNIDTLYIKNIYFLRIKYVITEL